MSLAESNCTCPFEPTPACCPQHGVLATSHPLSEAQLMDWAVADGGSRLAEDENWDY